jgi:cell division protein FtsQ
MNNVSQPVSPVELDGTSISGAGIIAALTILVVVFIIGQMTINHFRDPGRFPIRTVVVEGVYQHTSQSQLKERVLSQADRGFFNLDISTIQQEVEELPWVDRAYVRRIWPESINVLIEEHTPVARWGNDGLVSDKFKLFFPPKLGGAEDALVSNLVHELPVLYSPVRRHAALLKLHRETEPLFRAIEAPLVGISEDERRSVTLMLDGDVQVVIGHRLIAERIERFVDIFRSYVAPVYDDVARVDMRYTNGFAMARKSELSNNARVN